MKSGIAKSLFIFGLLVLLNGCASPGPPLPPSLELPRPVTDLRALRKGDRIYLAWSEPTKTTDHLPVRHYGPTLVCRNLGTGMKECGTPVGEVAAATALPAVSKKSARSAQTTTAYIDPLPTLPGVQPGDELVYAVEVQNGSHHDAGLSNQVHVPALPAIAPPDGFRAEVTAQGVKITWACFTPPQFAGVEYKLRIFRRMEDSQGNPNQTRQNRGDETIGEPELSACAGQPFLDTSFEWEKIYDYRAAVVTVISASGKPAVEIEGDDTPSVQVFAHDVFPPTVPSGLQAVFSGPGQQPFVDLIWQPVTEADLVGYDVYRREEGGEAVKINHELIKTPAYRDDQVQTGRKYSYSVAAADTRGNESAKSEEASEDVP